MSTQAIACQSDCRKELRSLFFKFFWEKLEITEGQLRVLIKIKTEEI